jgi:hypothetical protein
MYTPEAKVRRKIFPKQPSHSARQQIKGMLVRKPTWAIRTITD